MFIPSPFLPSSATYRFTYDSEGRMHLARPSPVTDDGGIADANSLYATDAERYETIAPFLRANKARDVLRRNYVIQPGGACVYFEEEVELADSYDHGRVQFTAPSDRESFGHNSMDGNRLAGPTSRSFQVGQERIK